MTGNRFKRGLAAAGGQPVDPEALARFTAGADAHETAPAADAPAADVPLKIISAPEYDQGGKLSEGVLFRCTPAVFQELDFVFKHSTAKSKQKLLESILLPRLKEMAREIKGSE
ncbi:hypothetical protein JW897_17675 [Chromobacterium alkanivorans]|uniref:hypothetical protein n=1 Tax=Chromobacterium alkanivorans TaxID=1071719 RepID=UPI0019673F92|nr:hypothetical protein [Chromobacterium alkanivorans]MBN3005565.1 hypothetical protein [Chromobacterium alkanivorans]